MTGTTDKAAGPRERARLPGGKSRAPFGGIRGRRQLARMAAPVGDTAAQLGMLAPMVSPGLASPE